MWFLEPELVEPVAIRFADEVGDASANGMLGAFLLDAEHIAFLQHPTTQPHAAQDNFPALAVDDAGVPGAQIAGGLRASHQERGQESQDGKKELIHMSSKRSVQTRIEETTFIKECESIPIALWRGVPERVPRARPRPAAETI